MLLLVCRVQECNKAGLGRSGKVVGATCNGMGTILAKERRIKSGIGAEEITGKFRE